MVFIWVIGKIQRQIYEKTVNNSVKPDLLVGLEDYDRMGIIKDLSRKFSPKLQELSTEYSKSSFTNARIHSALAMVGILMILFLLIPGWLLYQNGVYFGVKEILWRALGFYLLLFFFGVYFFMRAVSRYAPFTMGELIQATLQSAIRYLSS
jgi:hypothetical protein